jgi:formate dehydrogenase maturation protein FdhE
MDWPIILAAYPDQTDIIMGVKALRERIDRAIDGVDIPQISTTCRDMENQDSFIALLAPACSAVWKEVRGEEPSFAMTEALRTISMDGEFPGASEEDAELLDAIAQNAFSRFLHLLREKNAQLIPDPWHKGDCPFCGTPARIGSDEEDKRTLHCLSCGHSWRFPRIKCPSCGNADHTTLGYFEAEGIQGVRVHFCRECTRYYKVIDVKTRPWHDAETEDALSLEFDELARSENFT